MLSLMGTEVSLVVKVLWKQISLIYFRVYLEVYVHKNPTRFSRWSVSLCPNTDTLVVLFDFTPTAHEPELSFEYINSAYLIKGKKITIMGEDTKENHSVEKLYMEYNTKYPTEDRKIEESINYLEKEIFFRF